VRCDSPIRRANRDTIEAILDVRSFRKGNERSWTLPGWGHPIAQGVFPIGVTTGDTFYPLGTAFVVSRIGIIMTARHVLEDAARFHQQEKRLRSAFENRSSYEMTDIGFSVLYSRATPPNNIEVKLWPAHSFQIARPTDVAIGSLVFNEGSFPYGVFALSPGMPKAKSTILSVGYAGFPEDGILLREIEDGSFITSGKYCPRLVVNEGRVTAIHNVRGVVVGGPCFSTDFDIEHALSGGPAFDESGKVCGINSAGLGELTGKPGSSFSMLYPALLSDVKLVAETQDGRLKMRAERTLLDLIRSGLIRTDGSERKAIVDPTPDSEGRFYISHIVEDHNKGFVFDDFGSLQEGKPAVGQLGRGVSMKKLTEN
jgi:hypothetical protein